MSSIRRSFLIALLLGSATATTVRAADAEAWAPFTLPVEITEDGLAGPGADWLSDRATDARFVLFGEAHGVEEMPRFVAAACATLRGAGYRYLALETGPWIAERLSTDGVAATVERYPYSITFDYDADVDLMLAAERLFDPPGRAIWGLDQAITAVHPFERLAEIGPTATARRLARGAHLKAALKAGRYLRQDHAADLDALRAAFAPADGSEAALILDAIEASARIFTAHVEGRIAESVTDRETYMMQRLRAELDAARAAGDDAPRVVFKMGGAHVMEGIGPNGVRTLGDFAQALAADAGADAVHVGLWRHAPEQTGLPADLFADDDDAFRLVDAGALRAARPDLLDGVPDDLAAGLRQYDALVVIRAPHAATRTRVPALEKRFATGLRLGLLVVVAPLLLGLVAVGPATWRLLRLVRRRPDRERDRPHWPWAATVVVPLGLAGLIGAQVVACLDPAPGTAPVGADHATWILLGVVGLGLVLTVIASVRRGWWSAPARVVLGLSVAGTVAAIALLFRWNLGGML